MAMPDAGRFLVRHLLAWVAASLAMLAVPFIASRLSWGLSSFFDHAGGVHVYELGWGSSPAALDDKHAVLDPWSPGVLALLCVISAVCIAADFGRHKLPWVSWALPILVALPPAVATGRMMSGNSAPPDLPGYVPFVVGTTFGVVVALLVGAYWGVILLFHRGTLFPKQSVRG
jgi:hypothetical protein